MNSWKDEWINAIKANPRATKVLSEKYMDEYPSIINSEATNNQHNKIEQKARQRVLRPAKVWDFMNMHRKVGQLVGLCLLALLTFAGSIKADPATLNIKNGDSKEAIKVSIEEVNSCYQGPYLGAFWTIEPGTTQLLNMGRNSAKSGCAGWVCLKFDPAPTAQEYQCFEIHGGNTVVLSNTPTTKSRSQNQYPGRWQDQGHVYITKQIPALRAAEGKWAIFCNWGECADRTIVVDSQQGEVSKLSQAESRELTERVEACAKVAGEGAVYKAESNVCYTRDEKKVTSWQFANEKSISKKLVNTSTFSITKEEMSRGKVDKVWHWVEQANRGNGWTNQPPTPERAVVFAITCPEGPIDPNGHFTLQNQPASASCSRLGKK